LLVLASFAYSCFLCSSSALSLQEKQALTQANKQQRLRSSVPVREARFVSGKEAAEVRSNRSKRCKGKAAQRAFDSNLGCFFRSSIPVVFFSLGYVERGI
jgi:hypothetical protein